MNRRQRLAWVFASASAPVVMVFARAPWQWALVSGAIAVIYYYIVCRLHKAFADGCTLGALACEAFGGFGRILLVLGAAWTLLAAADTATGSAAAFAGEQERRLSGTVLLVLAAYGSVKGTTALARCAAVLAPILAAIYTVILFAAMPQIEWAWCRAWGSPWPVLENLPVLLLPSAALFLRSRFERRRVSAVLAALGVAPALLAFVTVGCLSPQLAVEEEAAFYTLSKSMSLFSVMERFEPLVCAVLYLGFFCLLTLLVQSCAAMLWRAVKRNDDAPGWVGAVCCAAIFLLRLIPARLSKEVFGVGAAVFWGIFPLLTLLVVAVKISAKKVKKGVDKGECLW
ncbi:MAG: hypothetical protein IIV87_04590 [Oscillospiraceae bacterium]|nr:hypothetical protein [Oscillospiraceae bacterium]